MSKTIYLECYSGISGDMTVAALLDLGADVHVLEKALKSLPVDGFEYKISRVNKAGLDVCDFRVLLDKEHENHDHDMEYLHGKNHDHDMKYLDGENHNHVMEHIHGVSSNHDIEGKHLESHNHDLEHLHGTMHDESHEVSHPHEGNETHSHIHDVHAPGDSHTHKHETSHVHRGISDIYRIIHQADMTQRAKNVAIKIFDVIAKAEAKAHGIPEKEVHFHEVGAVDSIVDIVAVAVCIDNLDITKIIVPELYEGRGFVRCQHGLLPIPVPAVANIVSAHGLNLHITSTEGELVTPTGAAIVAAIITSDVLPKNFSIEKIGIGAGKRSYDRPSMLRVMMIHEQISNQDIIYKLETNIDDCSGENLGYVMDKLMEAGAREVHYSPVFMKKNRPAYELNVICKEEDISRLEEIIFYETTTIGIRRVQMERTILKREIQTIQTTFGDVQVKVCQLEGKDRVYPEYSSIVTLCQRQHMTYQEAYHFIQEEYQKQRSIHE